MLQSKWDLSQSFYQGKRACLYYQGFDAKVKARAEGKSWPPTASIGFCEPRFLPMSQAFLENQHLCLAVLGLCHDQSTEVWILNNSLILQVEKLSHGSQSLLLWPYPQLISRLQLELRGLDVQVGFLTTPRWPDHRNFLV